MAQLPLNPEGGKAEKVYARVAQGQIARVDEAVKRRGMTRSDFIRLVLAKATEDDFAILQAS